jgi:predicted metal-dependent HD superfamily phosphohydrolase
VSAAPPDTAALLQQWNALGRSSTAWASEGRRLLRHWQRWPRAYHDLTHLQACLAHWQTLQVELPGALQQPEAVALALWFHDAVYWPWSSRNEARSAQWASRFLSTQRQPPSLVRAVAEHIMATRHHPGEIHGDATWVVDIDLAVLGQSDAVYRQFERNVRKEYFVVRWPRYRAGRSAVLQGFLDRPRIYHNEWFFYRYEAQARTNLRNALEALQAGRIYA